MKKIRTKQNKKQKEAEKRKRGGETEVHTMVFFCLEKRVVGVDCPREAR